MLINNAGIGVAGAFSGRCESPDGFELRFSVDYLSGFLLTRLLLPANEMQRRDSHHQCRFSWPIPIDFSNVMLNRGYSGRRAYGQSKLAQILFTFDLAQELANTGITVNALHPATLMDTEMVHGDGITPVSSVDER